MSRRRKSYEAGHQAKYLVIIDQTPECDRAMYYASRRAARVGVSVMLLRVIETRDHGQQWLEDADISVLVLAAGVGTEGPGPLVSHLLATAGAFPIPVAIVPGHLTDVRAR